MDLKMGLFQMHASMIHQSIHILNHTPFEAYYQSISNYSLHMAPAI